MAEWRFYGRTTELDALTAILRRNRWFFAKITGRRRIGKTTLVQQAIAAHSSARIVYVQIPDSGDAGVLSTFVDALETFGVHAEQFPYPRSLSEMAATIEALIAAGTRETCRVIVRRTQSERAWGFSSFQSHSRLLGQE